MQKRKANEPKKRRTELPHNQIELGKIALKNILQLNLLILDL